MLKEAPLARRGTSPTPRLTATMLVLLLALALGLHCAPAASQQAEPAVVAERPTLVRPLDLEGLGGDTAHFIAYQMVAMAAMSQRHRNEDGYLAPPQGFDRWRENVTNPVKDKDAYYNNYLLHPYWGASYYVRGRERGLERGQAFWYSVMMSAIFEYGAEAMVEPVSYQDLVITPVVGSLLGELLFWPVRERILTKDGPLDTTDKVVLVLTDPLGAINSAVDRLLGVKTELALGPRMAPVTAFAPGPRPAPRTAGWGLQFRAQW